MHDSQLTRGKQAREAPTTHKAPSPGSPHVHRPCRCHWWLLSPLERREGGRAGAGSLTFWPRPTSAPLTMTQPHPIPVFILYLPGSLTPALLICRVLRTSCLPCPSQFQPSPLLLPGASYPPTCALIEDPHLSSVLLPATLTPTHLAMSPRPLTCPGSVCPEPRGTPACLGQQVHIDCVAHSPNCPQQQAHGSNRPKRSQGVPL